MTAFVNETVVPLPPRSGVKVDRSPDWQTASVAFSSLHYTVNMSEHSDTTHGPGRLLRNVVMCHSAFMTMTHGDSTAGINMYVTQANTFC